MKAGLEKQLGELSAAKKGVEEKLTKLDTDFEAYKESVKDRLAQVDDLENSRNEVARNLEEAQTLNQRIPELEKQLKDRESVISRLKAEVTEIQGSVTTLEESNTRRGADIERLEGDINKRNARLKDLQEEIDSLTGKGLTPKISASEYAKLLDELRKKTSRIELLEKWSKQLEEQIEEIHIVGKGEKNILDQMNDLRMDLLRLGKDRMKLQEDLKNEQEARRRYSSPENTIIEWAQAHGSGKIDVLMKFYAENNRHRKRFEEGSDEERGKLAAEFREFAAYEIDPRVLSVTINPKERQATVKLTLRMTLDGRTVEMPATMLLVREYDQWAILSEGF
jgi:chromosome segregation ATPase